jgi:hypothetical protein
MASARRSSQCQRAFRGYGQTDRFAEVDAYDVYRYRSIRASREKHRHASIGSHLWQSIGVCPCRRLCCSFDAVKARPTSLLHQKMDTAPWMSAAGSHPRDPRGGIPLLRFSESLDNDYRRRPCGRIRARPKPRRSPQALKDARQAARGRNSALFEERALLHPHFPINPTPRTPGRRLLKTNWVCHACPGVSTPSLSKNPGAGLKNHKLYLFLKPCQRHGRF